jgi:hypothetical protein
MCQPWLATIDCPVSALVDERNLAFEPHAELLLSRGSVPGSARDETRSA